MEQPTFDAGTQSSSAGRSSEHPATGSGLEHSSRATGAAPVLGPDGKSVYSGEDFNSGFGRMVGRHPVLASVTSVAVGLWLYR